MIEVLTRLAPALEDRYRIDGEIGSGGMATVYRARDIRHEREVALKVLRPELAAVLGAQRFLNEIAITARLDHPHILTLIDSGVAEGFLYYVLPFVRGESLRDRLSREKQLALEDAIGITKDIGSALEHAHRHGVIHRDVKPENILIHEGEAVLADFGIALAVKEAGGTRLTQSGLSLGTPQYMSPEQATGDRALDARSDEYSLAAVLYEMLVGEPPHSGPNIQAVIAKLLTQRPVKIRALRESVPVALEAAVEKGLAKLPADRFPTIDGFIRAITTPATHQRTEFHWSSWGRVAAAGALVAVTVIAVAVGLKSRAAVQPDIAQRPTIATSSGSLSAKAVPFSNIVSPGRQTSETALSGSASHDGPKTPARDDLATADSARAAALDERRSAVAAGAKSADLARGDTALDAAEASAREGKVSDAVRRFMSAGAVWKDVANSRRNARAEIESVIHDYARAAEWQDQRRMAAAFPELTVRQRSGWEQFFQSARGLQVKLTLNQLQIVSDTAYADLKGTYSFVMRSDGQTNVMPVSFRATLNHIAGKWRLKSVE